MIVWEGNKKEFGTAHQSPPIPQNAIKIRDSEGFIGKATPFGIAPMIICMLIVFNEGIYIQRTADFSNISYPSTLDWIYYSITAS